MISLELHQKFKQKHNMRGLLHDDKDDKNARSTTNNILYFSNGHYNMFHHLTRTQWHKFTNEVATFLKILAGEKKAISIEHFC